VSSIETWSSSENDDDGRMGGGVSVLRGTPVATAVISANARSYMVR
jgi:hypothetical protein